MALENGECTERNLRDAQGLAGKKRRRAAQEGSEEQRRSLREERLAEQEEAMEQMWRERMHLVRSLAEKLGGDAVRRVCG